MPLFVMISGYLSRNFWDSKGKVNKLVDTILIPYVIVEFGYAALRWGLGGKWSLTITDPAWMNWYLVALLLWRITVPVWKRLRWPFPVAVAVYLISGFSQLEQDFSMDRFFGLLPFFVLGMILQPHHFEWLQKSWVRMIGAFVLAGLDRRGDRARARPRPEDLLQPVQLRRPQPGVAGTPWASAWPG